MPLIEPALTRVGRALHDDAVAWRVSEPVVLGLLVVPFAGALAVAASFERRPVFRFLTREDSLLEWSQFAGYAAAAVFALLAAWLLRASRRPWASLFLLLALGCLFVAGEEISWGQRLFGWGTPEALEEVNHQEETTVHNVRHVQDAFNVALLCAGLYGAGVPLLAAFAGGRWRRLPWLVVPPLSLAGAFLVLFAYKVLRFTLFPEPRAGVVKFGEWPELCFAGALLVFTLLVWRRLRAGDRV